MTEQHALVIASYKRELMLETITGELRAATSRGSLPALIAGDKVQWSETGDAQAVVETLTPRHNLLEKRNRYGKSKLVASNIDKALIVIAPEPEPYTELVDRYLVALANANIEHDQPIEVVLIGNKNDLTESANWARFTEMMAMYADIGISSYLLSAKSAASLEALQQDIHGKNAILLGQSGVGKSSITRQLAGVEVRTQMLSEASGFGKHTTTATTAYPLKSGAGYLIDSPGVRGFSPDIDTLEALDSGYPEILEHSVACQFRDCAHTHEPNCAVLAAAARGEIYAERLDNYHHIREKLALLR